MAGAISSSLFAAIRRMRIALAASACAHLCVVAALLPGVPLRPGPPAGPVISARLVLPHAPPGLPAPAVPPAAAAPVRQPGRVDAAVLPGPEPSYYLAQELDAFPQPLAPLDLRRLEEAAEGAPGIRAVLKIDERGLVRDVEIAGAGGRAREALRAELTRARFAPGLKEGRPVRSRIVLDLRLADYRDRAMGSGTR